MLTKTKRGVFSSPHFWIITFLVIVLLFIYYSQQVLHYRFVPLWNLEYFELTHNFIGSLFCIPFVYSFIIFGWRGILITWVICLGLIFPKIYYVSFGNAFLTNNLLLLFVPLMLGIFISLELRWRKKERITLAERDKERQSYLVQVMKAQEIERQRIARELHDETIQMLYVIANQARGISDEAEQSDQSESEALREAILQVADDVRRIIADLRPTNLDELSLSAALRSLANRQNPNDKVKIDIVVIGQEQKVKKQADIVIYRIVQEALNNALKHSQADHIRVTLEFCPDICKIKIKDNGTGFRVPAKISTLGECDKFGLIGMHQRVKALGGALKISSESNKGTEICFEIVI